MKSPRMIASFIAALLVVSAVAQDGNAQSTNSVVTQQQGSGDNGEHTIVVDVWSKSEPEEPAARSKCHQRLRQPALTPRSRWS